MLAIVILVKALQPLMSNASDHSPLNYDHCKDILDICQGALYRGRPREPWRAIARTQGCGSLRLPETQRLTSFRESVDSQPDRRTLRVIWCAIAGRFRLWAASQAEILVLRHQLNILRRRSPKRVVNGKVDRLVFCGLCRLSPTVPKALLCDQQHPRPERCRNRPGQKANHPPLRPIPSRSRGPRPAIVNHEACGRSFCAPQLIILFASSTVIDHDPPTSTSPVKPTGREIPSNFAWRAWTALEASANASGYTRALQRCTTLGNATVYDRCARRPPTKASNTRNARRRFSTNTVSARSASINRAVSNPTFRLTRRIEYDSPIV
jgi:hypothetical protein